jgi:hypothetical protein
MPDGGRTQARVHDFRSGLHADVGYLREQCAVLREACTRSQQTAYVALREAARIHADAQRSRGELVRARLPRDASCAAAARRLVETHLAGASADEIADVKSVVSELVSNAFLHGKGAIELRLSNRRGRARIEVIDDGDSGVAQVKPRDRPHGLRIVGALSLAWGTLEGSTRVWAELPAGGRTGWARQRLPTSRDG